MYSTNVTNGSHFWCVTPCGSKDGTIAHSNLLHLSSGQKRELTGFLELWHNRRARVYDLKLRNLVLFPAEESDFSSVKNAQAGCRNHTASYWLGNGCFFPGVKQPGIVLLEYFLTMLRLRISGTTLSQLASKLIALCKNIMYVFMYECMYVWMKMFVCMNECMYVCMCVCMYVYMYARM